MWWRTEPPPDGLLNPTHYVERMVGDKVSLLQERQRLEALVTLGYYKGSATDTWGVAATAALKAAQAALGVDVDGQWGPKTEDAIQAALGTGGCTDEVCQAPTGPTGPSTDALQGVGRLGWGLVAGVTLTGVALGVALALRGARA